MSSQMSGQYPLNNLAYDVIALMYEKSKALEAYDKYMQDARGDEEIRKVFEQIRSQDSEQIEQLKRHIGRLIGQGGEKQAGS